MRKVRCAIYTRKSSEEGLEQAFNSLDAQREACAAYIRSQASEGWTELPQLYDDGGLSGGSLERPALKRLLDDINSGKVDIVVVYKVDRLTRSLLDFARLVETFDRSSVSFVSITQSFCTTTSMGRLTLNMLLSFAQFEREVTAERIRDKIAASKARGMWMGGVPPLGYKPDGRTLSIVPDHAAIVREVYESYLALGNVRLVSDRLVARGVISPVRSTSARYTTGGKPFSRGQLYFILKSPIYVGDIPHREKTYPGLHEAIIDRQSWERVQSMLAEHTRATGRARQGVPRSPLARKVSDTSGLKMGVSDSCKGSRRYRYYVGQSEENGRRVRIPAAELETTAAECLAGALDGPVGLLSLAGLTGSPHALSQIGKTAGEIAGRLRRRDHATLRVIVNEVRLLEEGLAIYCQTSVLAGLLGISKPEDAPTTFQLTTRARLRRSGHVFRLVQANGMASAPAPARSLVKLLIKSRRWWGELRKGAVDITELAAREGVTTSYMTRVVRLAFLSPSVIDAILAGRSRAELDGVMMTLPGAVDARWAAQARRFLPVVRSD